MHCAQARTQIALLVGSDLPEGDRPEVQRHLLQCKTCSQYHRELVDQAVSIWDDIAPQIQLASANRQTRSFNGYVAGLAVAATVMAMFAISGNVGPDSQFEDSGAMAPVWNSSVSHTPFVRPTEEIPHPPLHNVNDPQPADQTQIENLR